MKKLRKEKEFLEQLAICPNISIACERTGISRNTIYRWKKEDEKFEARLEDALITGVDSINDLAESKVVGEIRAGNLSAAKYWLDNNKKNYVRPRPKGFWDSLGWGEKKVTGMKIEFVDYTTPKDKIDSVNEEFEQSDNGL
jgi:hypothetical protein